MSIAIGPWIPLAFIYAILYNCVVRPRDPTGRVRFILAILWSIPTLIGIYYGIYWFHQSLNSSYDPRFSPNTQDVFAAILFLVVLPEVSVLGLIIIDLILFRSIESFFMDVNNAKYLYDTGQLDNAKELFTKVTLAYPRKVAGWRGLGLTLIKMAAYEEDLTALNRALELNSHIAECWYNKAHSLARLSEKGEAIEALEKAISLSEKARELAKDDSAFDSLREDSFFR
jgi:tetratricopeptide (TPR) repeat protein